VVLVVMPAPASKAKGSTYVSKAGARLLRAAQEMRAIARGEAQPALVHELLHYTACGRDDVYLVSGFTRERIDGEDAVTIEDLDGLWKAIDELRERDGPIRLRYTGKWERKRKYETRHRSPRQHGKRLPRSRTNVISIR
jgi:hypothetical protein